MCRVMERKGGYGGERVMERGGSGKGGGEREW